MRLPVVLALATLAACSSKKHEEHAPPPRTPTPAVGTLVRGDAGITSVIVADHGDMHMDEDGAALPVPPPMQQARLGKPIDITLRSSPPGAQVAVDGTVLGHTPAFWSGMADGREHEFVFAMRGHAIARYRFVPVASGVIHGRLDAIHEETDAGVPTPPPEVVPPRSPATPTITPPAAPATVVTDGGVATPPGPVGPTPGSADSAPVGPQP